MIETLREVRKQEYRRLWDRLPGVLGSTLLIVEVAWLGWDRGVWTGLASVVAVTLLTRTIPSTWRPAEWLVDLAYHTVMNAFVVRVLWLLLVVDLWIAQDKGPSSIPMVLVLYLAALVVPFVTRRLCDFVASRAARES